jgi:hypothetical protein
MRSATADVPVVIDIQASSMACLFAGLFFKQRAMLLSIDECAILIGLLTFGARQIVLEFSRASLL